MSGKAIGVIGVIVGPILGFGIGAQALIGKHDPIMSYAYVLGGIFVGVAISAKSMDRIRHGSGRQDRKRPRPVSLGTPSTKTSDDLLQLTLTKIDMLHHSPVELHERDGSMLALFLLEL